MDELYFLYHRKVNRQQAVLHRRFLWSVRIRNLRFYLLRKGRERKRDCRKIKKTFGNQIVLQVPHTEDKASTK